LINAFGAGMFNSPHGIHVDRDGNVWVTDQGANPPNGKGHVVCKSTATASLLMTLGKAGVSGDGLDRFNNPSASWWRQTAIFSSPTATGR
jgi:hypothetical protein